MEHMENNTFLKTLPQNIDLEDHDRNYKPEKLFNYKQFLGIILGLIHVINSGMINGFASVVLAQAKDNVTFPITRDEAPWIISIAILPMAPASLLCGVLLNIAGKKTLLTIISIFDIATYLIMYASTSVKLLLISRALNGLTMGMGITIIPPYLAEISHPQTRSFFLAILVFGLSLGVLIIHVLGAFFTWNMCALISGFIMVIFLCITLYLPETYVWHLRNGNIEKAQKAFYSYRGYTSTSKMEMEKFIATKHELIRDNYTKKEMLKLYCSKLLLMPLGISCVGMTTMHLSGNKTIMYYSISIISNVIPSMDQYTSSIIVDVVRIVMTGVGSYLVNKYPMRPLYILSGVGSAMSHFCFAVLFSFVVKEHTSQLFSILSLLALISYIIFSSIGIVPLTWLIAGEIFPIIVRGVGSGLFSFAYFMVFFIAVKVSADLFDAFGILGAFIFYGSCTALGTMIMYFILPETKNKTLKEIEDLFKD